MSRDDRRPPPGSVVSELRRDLRRLGVRRAARRWGLRERQALELCAGLRVDRAALLTAVRRLLADLEGRDG